MQSRKKEGGVRTERGVIDQPLSIEPLSSHHRYQTLGCLGGPVERKTKKKEKARREVIIDACEHEPDLTLSFFCFFLDTKYSAI